MARIIKIDPNNPDIKKIKAAAETIKDGGLVAFPTDTFYGLGADATNDDAVKKVYAVKERDYDKPILILIDKRNKISKYVKEMPSIAEKLMKRFWPGPLTIIFLASSAVSQFLLGRGNKIGIRIPNNPLTLLFLKTSDHPVTATSANISGEPSPADAVEIKENLRKKIDIILDAGKTTGTKASTVIDVTEHPPICIREGMITVKEIEGFLGIKLRRGAL